MSGNVGVLLLTWFLYAIGNSITMPYLSIYMKMLGASPIDIGIAYSVATAAQLIMMMPGGYLTDTIGRRRSIVVGTWIMTVTLFLMAIPPNWQVLVVIYALNSAAAFYQPALLALLLDSLPPSRYASGILITSVIPQIPWLILPPVGGFLISKYGLLGIRIAYLISAFISLVVALIRQYLIKETLNNVKGRVSIRETLRSYYLLRSITKLPASLLRVYITMLILFMALMPMNTLLPIYVVYKMNLNTTYWGYLVSLSNAAYVVINLVLTFYVDKLRNELVLLGVAIMATGSALGLFSNLPSIATYLILLQVGSQLVITALQSRVGYLVGTNRRGHSIGLLIIFQLLGQTIGSYLSGELYRLSTSSLFLMPLLLSITIMIINLLPGRSRGG
ncbi:MAG: MFS transporter [Vulcanisaeta sp.]|nr:MFS transporter [Vulcanisaeta sp.]